MSINTVVCMVFLVLTGMHFSANDGIVNLAPEQHTVVEAIYEYKMLVYELVKFSYTFGIYSGTSNY